MNVLPDSTKHLGDLLSARDDFTKWAAMLGPIVMNLINAWSTAQQAWRIFSRKSALNVSVSLFVFALVTKLSILMYGFEAKLFAPIFSGVMGVTVLAVCIGLIRYAKMSRADLGAIVAGAVGCVVVIFAPDQQPLFLGLSVIYLLTVFDQMGKLYAAKALGLSRGDVQVGVHITSLMGNAFWVWYGFTFDDPVFAYFGPAMAAGSAWLRTCTTPSPSRGLQRVKGIGALAVRREPPSI